MACVHVSPRLVVPASLAASPRLDFGVRPNCASRLRENKGDTENKGDENKGDTHSC